MGTRDAADGEAGSVARCAERAGGGRCRTLGACDGLSLSKGLDEEVADEAGVTEGPGLGVVTGAVLGVCFSGGRGVGFSHGVGERVGLGAAVCAALSVPGVAKRAALCHSLRVRLQCRPAVSPCRRFRTRGYLSAAADPGMWRGEESAVHVACVQVAGMRAGGRRGLAGGSQHERCAAGGRAQLPTRHSIRHGRRGAAARCRKGSRTLAQTAAQSFIKS